MGDLKKKTNKSSQEDTRRVSPFVQEEKMQPADLFRLYMRKFYEDQKAKNKIKEKE